MLLHKWPVTWLTIKYLLQKMHSFVQRETLQLGDEWRQTQKEWPLNSHIDWPIRDNHKTPSCIQLNTNTNICTERLETGHTKNNHLHTWNICVHISVWPLSILVIPHYCTHAETRRNAHTRTHMHQHERHVNALPGLSTLCLNHQSHGKQGSVTEPGQRPKFKHWKKKTPSVIDL